MDVGADGMSGAVNEIFTEAILLDVAAGGSVDFPSGDTAARIDRIGHSLYADVAGITHDFKYLAHAVRWRLADETHPCDVVIDRSRNVFFPPHVEQDQIAFANGNGTVGAGLVVRIAGIGIHGNDRRIVGEQILAAERFHEPLLDSVFGRPTVPGTLSDFLEGGSHD